jgi:hypothetical protein
VFVKDKAERIRYHMRIQKNVVRRSYVPMKSAAACVGLSELIAGVTQYREHLDKKKPPNCQH